MSSGIVIGRRFQGPTGSGQGGWTAHRFASVVGHPIEVSILAPIPLETELAVVSGEASGSPWRLVAGTEPEGAGTTIMTGSPMGSMEAATSPVTIAAAEAARRRFGAMVDDHPVPECFSCGLRPDSMRVHAAPLEDGTDRYASDWTVPEWAATGDGVVDHGVVWAALDCAAAWYVCTSRGRRTAFTVRYSVEVRESLVVGERYSLVSWAGDFGADWDGRKRGAASAAFASDGTCVAGSTSLWVSVDG